MNEHDVLLDDAAMLALGALSPEQAAEVRAHLQTCDECMAEYRRLKAIANLLPLGAADPDAAENVPAPGLKAGVMALTQTKKQRAGTHYLLPAYLPAAACLALAVFFGAMYAIERTHVNSQNATIADLVSPVAQRYTVSGGEVVRSGGHIYLAMRGMPPLPAGKVYQAWTLPKGSKRMAPSAIFTPKGGSASLRLPVDARAITAVAVSVEPAGGSAQPTSKPLFVVTLHG